MTVWFVTRHPGAIEWAAQQGLQVDRQVAHLDVAEVQPGDVVIGILPVNLAAQVCSKPARYLHLSITQSFAQRGVELSAQQMRDAKACLQEFNVMRVLK